ncbi:MAG: hypothetical protein OEZ06_23070 [Myxococcales bacterium]|nr:hypothetical protein [Myxococcales bacterium]
MEVPSAHTADEEVRRERERVEAATRTARNRGDYAETTRIVFEAYGQELYSFALAQFSSEPSSADEVFSQFSEDFWVSLPRFQWRCSARAWCYKLLRNATHRHRRSPENRAGRRVPLSAVEPWLRELVVATRHTTQAHLRSEVKDEVRLLRERLRPEDQDLLILRVDRNMPWRDIAHAMLPDDAEGPAAEQRFEATLRRRFTEVKKRIRKLAIEAGLLESAGG